MKYLYSLKKDLMDIKIYISSLTKEQFSMIITLIFTAIIVILFNKYGLQTAFFNNYTSFELTRYLSPDELSFWSNIYFFGCSLVMLVIMPLILYCIAPHKGPNPFGLTFHGISGHFIIYFCLFCIMIPLIWIACGDPLFNQFYPFYDPESLSKWVLYEMLYMSHFFAIEFFFRGYLLFRFEPVFKEYTLWVVLVPYVFVHIFKPLPEAMGSVFAGIVLGSLALKFRSIWPGIVLHCSVAFSADLFSLIRSGRLLKLLQ